MYKLTLMMSNVELASRPLEMSSEIATAKHTHTIIVSQTRVQLLISRARLKEPNIAKTQD